MNSVTFAVDSLGTTHIRASRLARLRWVLAIFLLLAAIAAPPRSVAQIAVGPNTEGNTGGGCSLQDRC